MTDHRSEPSNDSARADTLRMSAEEVARMLAEACRSDEELLAEAAQRPED